MKKVLIILPALLFIAAACNNIPSLSVSKTNNTQTGTNVQQTAVNNSTTQNQSTPTVNKNSSQTNTKTSQSTSTQTTALAAEIDEGTNFTAFESAAATCTPAKVTAQESTDLLGVVTTSTRRSSRL